MMSNKIIIEGFWNLGKTTLINKLHESYGYQIINEPDHLLLDILDQDRVDIWYQNEYSLIANIFLSSVKEKIVCERSLLDSGAFMYARDGVIPLPLKNKIFTFTNELIKNNGLVVFLFSSRDFILKQNSINNKNNVVVTLLKSERFINLYDDFFRKILPKEFKIIPLCIDVSNNNNFLPINEIFKKIELHKKHETIHFIG